MPSYGTGTVPFSQSESVDNGALSLGNYMHAYISP